MPSFLQLHLQLELKVSAFPFAGCLAFGHTHYEIYTGDALFAWVCLLIGDAAMKEKYKVALTPQQQQKNQQKNLLTQMFLFPAEITQASQV